MRIIVDVMSGDNAPIELVKGVAASALENPEVDYTLVGDKERIERIARDWDLDIKRFDIVHTDVVIAPTAVVMEHTLQADVIGD